MIIALQILIWLLIVGPAVPLAFLHRTGGGPLRRFALVGLSLSLIWLACSVADPRFIGPHYSELRKLSLSTNIWFCTIATAVLLIDKRSRVMAALTGAWVVFGWLYLQGISFVV